MCSPVDSKPRSTAAGWGTVSSDPVPRRACAYRCSISDALLNNGSAYDLLCMAEHRGIHHFSLEAEYSALFLGCGQDAASTVHLVLGRRECYPDHRHLARVDRARNRIRELTQRFVLALLVLFGDVFGREQRSCMDSPAR
jgi:hypothetical protein